MYLVSLMKIKKKKFLFKGVNLFKFPRVEQAKPNLILIKFMKTHNGKHQIPINQLLQFILINLLRSDFHKKRKKLQIQIKKNNKNLQKKNIQFQSKD